MAAYAVPADPTPHEITLPDGTTMQVRLVGDEYHSYYTLTDGTPLRRTADGFYERDDAMPEYSASVRQRRRAEAQTAAGRTFPNTGSPRSLVLLVGFKDLPFAQKRADFDTLLNQSGYSFNGATGSCRDYYIASSDSLFSPQFDVYGPYTLEHEMAYYGEEQGSRSDKNPEAMVTEACQLAAADISFKDYDTNNDGVLDNVFIFYAGHPQSEGAGSDAIWPHQGDVSYMSVRISGVSLASYACTSEYRGANGTTRCGIGTFCHEFGHVIGLPDLYDINYNYYSVGRWSIMCSGSYLNQGRTPPTFSSYERFFEGWLKPEQLSAPGSYSLEDLEKSNKAYLVAAETHNLLGKSPSPNEFFMLEYRDGTGWSSALPGKGMLVWHIDYNSAAWGSNNVNTGPNIMRVHLEEANGIGWEKRSNSEEGRASDPYPGVSKVTSWTPELHDGTVLNMPVFDITEEGGFIDFVFISSGGSNLRIDKERLDFVTTVADNNTIVDWEPQDFTIIGTGIDPQSSISISSSGMFYLFAGDTYPKRTSTAWRTAVTFKPQADSTVNQRIWVCYKPAKQNCDVASIAIPVKSSSAVLSLPVSGTAPRPTYISTPVVKPVSEITPYSFLASWKPVEDAERYYITLYQINEGTTDFVQGFENFNDPNQVALEGWQSTFNRTTSLAKADGTLSLYFKETGEQVVTETYPSVITSVSYWINAFTADVDTVAHIYLEALALNGWIEMQETVVTSRTKQKVITCDMPEGSNYTCFRLTFHNDGGKGVALDAFTATASEQITYIYRGNDMPISAVDDEAYTICYVNGLTPASTYYCSVQCTDLDKGCEEHLSPLSAPFVVTTLEGNDVDDKYLTLAIDSVNFDRPTHTVYVSNPTAGDVLGIFDAAGHLVWQIKAATNKYYYELPVAKFTQGAVYSIKYMKGGAMNRKQQWVKLVF